MRKLFVLILVVALFSCKKEETKQQEKPAPKVEHVELFMILDSSDTRIAQSNN